MPPIPETQPGFHSGAPEGSKQQMEVQMIGLEGTECSKD
jgi:hypothetical protein